MANILRRLLPRRKRQEGAGLDDLIPAEIASDAFHQAIIRQAASAGVATILEIGSSAGDGSTSAFVTGILQNPSRPRLYCMEVSSTRFQALRKAYLAHDFVRPFHLSSVPLGAFPTPEQVKQFYQAHATNLNNFPLDTVLGWLEADVAYVASHGMDLNGIRRIKETEGIESFDLVLIDGSEFTGRAELREILGARVIMLDDVNGFKNYENYYELKNGTAYRLEEEDWSLRNGYAIFRRV
ncbi:MAG: hypothetical protein P4L36_05930 [Holophaga sp.]|nr:hypothetical protein [Holophaga sp.]